MPEGENTLTPEQATSKALEAADKIGKLLQLRLQREAGSDVAFSHYRGVKGNPAFKNVTFAIHVTQADALLHRIPSILERSRTLNRGIVVVTAWDRTITKEQLGIFRTTVETSAEHLPELKGNLIFVLNEGKLHVHKSGRRYRSFVQLILSLFTRA